MEDGDVNIHGSDADGTELCAQMTNFTFSADRVSPSPFPPSLIKIMHIFQLLCFTLTSPVSSWSKILKHTTCLRNDQTLCIKHERGHCDITHSDTFEPLLLQEVPLFVQEGGVTINNTHNFIKTGAPPPWTVC